VFRWRWLAAQDPIRHAATARAHLGAMIEEMIGSPAPRGQAKRGPAPKIQQQLERLSQLPRARQRVVSEVLDSLLAQSR